MPAETTFAFSKRSLPQIAKAIGEPIVGGRITKHYPGSLRATIVENTETEGMLLRFSQDAGEEGRVTIGEMALDNTGVHIDSSGVIFARSTSTRGELVNFSKLTKDKKTPVIDGWKEPRGGVRKAAWVAREKRIKMGLPY